MQILDILVQFSCKCACVFLFTQLPKCLQYYNNRLIFICLNEWLRFNRLKSFLWQGTIGFEAQIDKCLELSEYLYNKIKDREGYEMVFDGKVRPHLTFFHFSALHMDNSSAATQSEKK